MLTKPSSVCPAVERKLLSSPELVLHFHIAMVVRVALVRRNAANMILTASLELTAFFTWDFTA